MEIAEIPYDAILIDDIKKDKDLKHTFANGQTIKIETLLKSVKENIGSDIIFIDATTIFNPINLHKLKDYFASFEPYDLCWQDNIGPFGDYNIGVTKIKCSKKMIEFFESVLDRIKAKKAWDQAACNFMLKETHLQINFSKFDELIVANRMDILKYQTKKEAWSALNKEFGNFYIFKHLMAHDNKTPEQISKIRVDVLNKLGLI
jgi:hypothetical protein